MHLRSVRLTGKWSTPETNELVRIMAKLPMAWVEHNDNLQAIERQPALADAPPQAPGHSKYDPESGTIVVYDKGVYHHGRIDPEQFRRSVYHELAHALVRGNPELLSEWTRQTRGDGFVDDYAKTSPEEDLADSLSEFLIDATATRHVVPRKAKFLAQLLARAHFQ